MDDYEVSFKKNNFFLFVWKICKMETNILKVDFISF